MPSTVRSDSPKRVPKSSSQPSISQATSSASLSAGQASSSTPEQKLTTPSSQNVDEEAEEEVDELLSSIIVVFFADGTDRYNDMTAYALRTFIDATPRILTGLLTHDDATAQKVLGTLAPSQRHRVLTKLTSSTPHFDNWNPTQYKLDIAQYAEAFETIFWFDSDTITFGDMTEFLTTFAASDARFYMTPDHVNSDAEFAKSWLERVGQPCVVPQACLMGFKDSVITHFFTFWEAIWKHWITPKPFANFGDPNPTFAGSEFCIEQYALGQSLAYKEEWIRDVMWFRRDPLAVPKSGAVPNNVFPSKKTSVQPNTIQKLIAQHPQNLVNVKELRSLQIPPKTLLKVSNSILVAEHFDYIDKFGNLYHCYNHSYERVKSWFQLYTAYGPSLAPKQS